MAASSSTGKSLSSCSEDENELRRGPWTVEEDTLLTQDISENGEGHWNLLAKCSGLRRTGKSCRLRWLNYLKPDVKRGNFSLHEHILILDLHLKWGSRWSKIAKHLPGRTDNEIKNHWRTRVRKQAKHLKLETNSPEFLNIIKMLWIPRLRQKIQESNPLSSSSSSLVTQNPPENPQICLQNPIYEHNSEADSMNFSPISHLSDDNPTFLPGCVNYDDFNQLDNVGYDLDAINMVLPSTAAINFDQSVGHFYRAESSLVENDFAGCLWNMDELWQYRNKL